MRRSFLYPFSLVAFSLSLYSCSAVTVTASRFAGVVLDTTMVVDVGTIWGDGGSQFREQLLKEIRSEKSFAAPEPVDHLQPDSVVRRRKPPAYLLIEGSYHFGSSESYTEEKVNEKTQKYRLTTYSVGFEYSIRDTVSGEHVTDGAIEDSKTDKDEYENKGFFESILSSFIESIFSSNPYNSLRDNIVRRFIREISPHAFFVEVKLFKDSDMPELESGIGYARAGKWKQAIDVFLSVIDKYPKHEKIHKAYYDVGVAYEYDHQYEFARENLEKAVQMEGSIEYINELHQCKRYQQEYNWREGYLERLRMMR